MVIYRFIFITFALLISAVPAISKSNPIVQQVQAFKEAFNAGDAEAVSTFYMAKGALLPPRNKAVIGRASIASHFAKAFRNGVSNLKVKILEIKMAGPSTAIEIGQTSVNAGDQTVLGRYLHVWKEVDGVWLIHRDMFHVLEVRQ